MRGSIAEGPDREQLRDGGPPGRTPSSGREVRAGPVPLWRGGAVGYTWFTSLPSAPLLSRRGATMPPIRRCLVMARFVCPVLAVLLTLPLAGHLGGAAPAPLPAKERDPDPVVPN